MKKYQIDFSRLINTELYQFLSLVAKSAKDADPAKSKFKPEYDAVDAILKRLLDAIDREKGSELTAEIGKMDARRDAAISGFVAWIKGYLKHPNESNKEAANTLQFYMDTHGTGIATQNLQAETTILSKIVEDCKTEAALKAALATLNGTEWIAEIEQANTAFINTYANRSSQLGTEQNKESFFDVRKEAIPAYEALIDMIQTRYKTAVADKTDTAMLQKCVNEIDATISQYRQLIKATQAHKKDTPPTPPTV